MMNQDLNRIYDSLKAGQRLSTEDAVTLYYKGDILKLAELANHRREAIHGDKSYFIKNKHIDYSTAGA